MSQRTQWKIDPAHTSIEFAVKHMMLTTVRGRFKQFDGSLEVDDAHLDVAHVSMEIEAASIDTGAPDRDKHLRSADFLDVDHHPKIRFESKRVEGAAFREGKRFSIVGDLTMRGKPMEITLDAIFEGMGIDPWGQQRAGFSCETQIDRREWGLQWNQALETGGILVANHVKIECSAQFVRQASAEAAAAARRPQAGDALRP